MSQLKLHKIHNTDRIGTDHTDLTQQNISNTKFANRNLTQFFNHKLSDDHVNFAIPQPAMNFNALSNGNGLNSVSADQESNLLINIQQQRPFEIIRTFVI